MNFQIKLNAENAEEEISYLNDFIAEHDIIGLKTEIPNPESSQGAMDGGLLNDTLKFVVSMNIGAVIFQIFTAIGRYFDGKRADIELSYKCPDSGLEFKEVYTFTGKKTREEIYEQFRQTIEKNCKKRIEILKP